jgi:hypothetical protein
MVGPSGAESLLASLFRRLGRGAARCPALFIAAPLVVFLAFLVGFKDLVIDTFLAAKPTIFGRKMYVTH